MTVDTTVKAQTRTELRPGWRVVRFDAMAENVNDRVDDPAEAGVEYYVGLEHLEPESLKIRRWGKPTDVEATKLRFKPGDIIFGRRRAYQRKLAVAEFEGICSAHAMVLRAREQVVLPEFLPFFMQSDIFFERAMSISVGSLSPTINWKTLAAQEFALPPRDEQRRIAEILWAADEAVVEWETTVAQTDNLRRIYRQNLFGDAHGWPRSKVGDLFEVQLGKMLSPVARKGLSPKPYLGNANVQWGRFNLEDVKAMDFDEEELIKFTLRPGDLLVCEGGEVGRSAIWRGEITECCYQKALHRLRPISDSILPETMLQYMFYGGEQGEFARLTGHSTIAHLTAVNLRELEIPVPPLAVQQNIINVFSRLEKTMEVLEEHILKTKELKRALLDRLK